MENTRKIEENKNMKKLREINGNGYGYKSGYGYGKGNGHGKGNGNGYGYGYGYGNKGKSIEYKGEELSGEEKVKRGNRKFKGHENVAGNGGGSTEKVLGKGVGKNILGRNRIKGKGGLGEVRANSGSISRENGGKKQKENEKENTALGRGRCSLGNGEEKYRVGGKKDSLGNGGGKKDG